MSTPLDRSCSTRLLACLCIAVHLKEEESGPQTEDNAHPLAHAVTTSFLLLDPHGLRRGSESSFGESTQGSSDQMSPPSSRRETFASEALFRVTGASLTFSTPFCTAHGGVDEMVGPDLSKS
jgi:hypothetical protein